MSDTEEKATAPSEVRGVTVTDPSGSVEESVTMEPADGREAGSEDDDAESEGIAENKDENGESEGDSENEDDEESADDAETGGGVNDGAQEEDEDKDEDAKESSKKTTKPGIVYLGHIPPRLRPKHMRNMLSCYGEIGRIFLQPEDHSIKRKKKKTGCKARSFTEGWVEFRSKRVAKMVAASLHNTPMGARKRNRFSNDLWCMKYLHRFHWCHLSERLAYEQTVRQQRLRTEISQAKRETNFYLANVEKSRNLDKRRKKRQREEGGGAAGGAAGAGAEEEKSWDFTQRRTEDEMRMGRLRRQALSGKGLRKAQDKARLIQEKSQTNVSLLAKIFSGEAPRD